MTTAAPTVILATVPVTVEVTLVTGRLPLIDVLGVMVNPPNTAARLADAVRFAGFDLPQCRVVVKVSGASRVTPELDAAIVRAIAVATGQAA